MKTFGKIATAAALSLSLAACSSEVGVDLGKVLDRTVSALTVFQDQLQKSGATKLDDAQLAQLPAMMQKAMNFEPPVAKGPVGIALLKDSKFEGFADANKNNIKDAGERRMFTVEIDFDGKRLIATGEKSGSSVGAGLGAGLLAGMLMGRLLGGQRAAGVKPGAFANRNVTPRSSYSRGKARSGGLSRGK